MPRDQILSDLFHCLVCLICFVAGRELDWGGYIVVILGTISVFRCWVIGGRGACDFDVVLVCVGGCNLGSM